MLNDYACFAAIDAVLRCNTSMQVDSYVILTVFNDCLSKATHFVENFNPSIGMQEMKNLLTLQEQIARCIGLSRIHQNPPLFNFFL